MFRSAMAAAFAVLMLAVLASPAEARWQRAESPRFIIYGDGSETVLRAYVNKMEVFDSLLRARHGLPETGVPLRKLPIYLVTSRNDLQRTWFGAGDGVAGYYLPGELETFAVATSDGRADDTALLHEYVHHFMLQNFPGAYPAWMIEGYAEYYSKTEITDKFIEVGQVQDWRASALRSSRWMPMADLLANKRIKGDAGTDSFYAQSWLLTHYLMSDPDRYKQFQAYASAVAKGGDPVKSMQDVTGMTPDALEKELRKYVNGGLKITQYKRTDLTKAAVTITTLPPSADDLLLERLQLVGHSNKDADPRYLELVTRRAAKYPGDRLATLTLAQAELELGDLGRAEAVLLPWIRDHPDDAEPRFVLATHYNDMTHEEKDGDVVQALRAKARDLLTPAVKAGPDDYRVLYAYAESRRGEAGYPGADIQDVLIRAYKQAPQVVPVRFELIQVLMARRHWREARALLGPLVNSPHGGQVADQAKAMLKDIQEREAEGA